MSGPFDPPFPESMEWSYAAVGKFLHAFAVMERSLDRAMACALNLDILQAIIVSSSMPVHSKLTVTKAAIQIFLDDKKKSHYTDQINKAFKLNLKRVIVAHQPFLVTDDGMKCQFFVQHSKAGKLQFPEEIWSQSDFEQRTAELWDVRTEFEALVSILEPSSPEFEATKRRLLEDEALMELVPWPIEGTFRLGPEFLEPLPFLELPSSDSQASATQAAVQKPQGSGE